MTRPAHISIDAQALLHNLAQVKHLAPGKSVIAMVKANAYGCGLSHIAPVLEGHVDAFGLASMDEALAIRALGCKTPCMLFQGVFSADEWPVVSEYQFSSVLHQAHQLDWLLATPLSQPVTIWLKVNTGMNRIGFQPEEFSKVVARLRSCPWVNPELGLITHMACADEPHRVDTIKQLSLFQSIDKTAFRFLSMANSATLMAFPQAQAHAVRPGIMLYGVSPFADKTAHDLSLQPVMHFKSAITAIHHYPTGISLGYGGTWSSSRPSIIGVVAVGYGDGYPRHVAPGTPVWINGKEVPIVGRISMDMMTVDLTEHPDVSQGTAVELWGSHLLIERIAQASGTIGYELLCQVTNRVRRAN